MANDTLVFLRQWIKFVPKEANPPCFALLRPIKDFWAALKTVVYDEGRQVTSFPTLEQKVRQKTREVPLLMILHLFITIKETLAICA